MGDDAGLWFSQSTTELHSEWWFLMSAGARVAWMMLKAHVKAAAVSQKRPNRAPRTSPAVAAIQWNLQRSEVEEMEATAIEAGALMIDGSCWVVTDVSVFQSERTRQRYQQTDESTEPAICPPNDDKPSQTTTDVPGVSVCPPNDVTVGQTPPSLSHATVTGTDTGTESLREEQQDRAPSEPSGDAGAPPSGQQQGSETTCHPFWVEASQHPDELVRKLCHQAWLVAKFRAHPPDKMRYIEDVLAREREHAPSDECLKDEIRDFGIYWQAQGHIRNAGTWWLTFGNWCKKNHGKWALAKEKATRKPAPKNVSGQNLKESVDDVVARRTANQGITTQGAPGAS
jgi:hypothetical protein